MALFKIWNGPMMTTGSRDAVATGIVLKTMLQVKGISQFRVREWGVSGDGAALAAGIKWELLTTGAIPATVTAAVAADVALWDRQALEANITPANRFTLGVGATGYTGSAEGVIVATRSLDTLFLTPTESYVREFRDPPVINIAEYLRIRCLAAASVNATCWMLLEA